MLSPPVVVVVVLCHEGAVLVVPVVRHCWRVLFVELFGGNASYLDVNLK